MSYVVSCVRRASFACAFRLALVCVVVLPVLGALPRPAPHKFSSNLLAGFGNSSFVFEGSSIASLPNDTGFIATGWVRSPSGAKIPGVVDAPDVAHVNTTARMGLVLRISSSAEILWARRTCALPEGAALHAAVSATGSIFVAGSRLVGGSTDSYLVLARYHANGTELYFRDSHSFGAGYAYAGIVVKGTQTVLLAADLANGAFPNSKGGKGAPAGSVALIEAFQSNGTMRRNATLTRSAGNTTESERTESVALSADMSSLYVLVRSVVVVKYTYNKTDTVYELDPTSLHTPPRAQARLDYLFGNDAKMAVIGGVVHVGQIVKSGSAVQLRVTRLTGRSLKPSNWPGCDVNMCSKIFPHPDPGQARVPTTLASIIEAPPHLRAIVSSQSNLNDTDHGSSPLSEDKNNLRPSVIDLGIDGMFGAASTAETGRTIVAADAVRVGNDTLVFGTDEQDPKATALYLAVVGSPLYVNVTKEVEERGGAGEVVGAACIGVGSVVNGLSIEEAIRGVGGARKQHHPLRKIQSLLLLGEEKVKVMCFPERGSRVCATPGHVMFERGVARFMRDICSERRCEEEMQNVVSFKGRCGTHVPVHDELSISMHSASLAVLETGRNADEVVFDECTQRDKSWMRWFTSTL